METFLVRVWVPSEHHESVTAATLHGLAQHVRSGFTTAFADGDQLCAWLESMASEQGGAVSKTRLATEGLEEGDWGADDGPVTAGGGSPRRDSNIVS